MIHLDIAWAAALQVIANITIGFAYVVGLGPWCWFRMKAVGKLFTIFFSLFIILCGFTHFAKAYYTMQSICEISVAWVSVLEAVTAAVSLGAALIVWTFFTPYLRKGKS